MKICVNWPSAFVLASSRSPPATASSSLLSTYCLRKASESSTVMGLKMLLFSSSTPLLSMSGVFEMM